MVSARPTRIAKRSLIDGALPVADWLIGSSVSRLWEGPEARGQDGEGTPANGAQRGACNHLGAFTVPAPSSRRRPGSLNTAATRLDDRAHGSRIKSGMTGSAKR